MLRARNIFYDFNFRKLTNNNVTQKMMEEWRVLFQKSLDLKKENADKTQALLVERDLVEYDSMVGEWEYSGDILKPGEDFLSIFSEKV